MFSFLYFSCEIRGKGKVPTATLLPRASPLRVVRGRRRPARPRICSSGAAGRSRDGRGARCISVVSSFRFCFLVVRSLVASGFVPSSSSLRLLWCLPSGVHRAGKPPPGVDPWWFEWCGGGSKGGCLNKLEDRPDLVDLVSPFHPSAGLRGGEGSWGEEDMASLVVLWPAVVAGGGTGGARRSGFAAGCWWWCSSSASLLRPAVVARGAVFAGVWVMRWVGLDGAASARRKVDLERGCSGRVRSACSDSVARRRMDTAVVCNLWWCLFSGEWWYGDGGGV